MLRTGTHMEKQTVQKELSGFVGRLLREQFGKGPETVFSTVSDTLVTIYFTGFLSPLEKSLMQKDRSLYVQKTRDLLMETLIEEINVFIHKYADLNVNKFYYDWNLEKESGMFVAIGDGTMAMSTYPNQEKVEKGIMSLTEKAEKQPEVVHSHLINERTLLIIREGLLINIEKELNRLGFQETLKLAKRNLERRLIEERKKEFEKHTGAQIVDYFVDWDFDHDKSAILFVLNPGK